MKKLIVSILGIAAVVALASAVRAGIAGSKHDLSGAGYGTDQICVFCHTPHNAQTPQLVPLWNHQTTATATFTLYSSPTLNAVPGQPTGASKACLSCHDGTVAVDSFGGNTNGTHFITGTALLGTDLSDDHPIAFTYDATLATADTGLYTPVSASYVDAAHKVPLFAGKLECASCHDVHDNSNTPFLRKSNTGSALCLTCHNK